MVVRWDPFRDLMSIQGELNRLFGRTYAGTEGESGTALATGSSGALWAPPLDVVETGDELVVTVELPGIEPDDVEVSVEDSTLSVTGSREFSSDVSEENYRRIERRYGSFSRQVSLPATADAEHVEATFDRGVLTIRVPKLEEAKPRKIEIKAAG